MLKRILAFLSVMLACSTLVFAGYPERTITLIVPFGAGGATDIPARFLADEMEKKLGQTIIVQNVVGAAGTQGIARLTAAKPDGYTIGYAPTGTICLQPHVQKVPFGRDSFDFLGLVTRQPVVLMSSKTAPWKTFEEMVEIIKKEPNKYIVAITGTANMTHIPVIELAEHFDLKLRYIPYRSTAEVMKDMIAGRTHLYADSPVPLSQFDIFGLIQFAENRAENLDFPTTKEMGFERNISHWQGIIAPKGLPQEVKNKLGSVIKEIVESPEFAAALVKMNTKAESMGPEEFAAFFEQEFDAYGEVLSNFTQKK